MMEISTWRGRAAGALLMMALVWPVGLPVVSAYEIVDVSHGGSLSGQVTFTGELPVTKRFTVEKDQEVCGAERALMEIAAEQGRLQGAVAVLKEVERGKPFAAETYQGTLPGRGEYRYHAGAALSLEVVPKTCAFGPLTGVLALGQPIQFRNQDPMKHVLQTFAVSGEKGRILRTIHNRDLRPGVMVERTFEAEMLRGSQVVRMACNRHDFMQNWLYVVDSPYYAISDEQGRFTIAHIPSGRYELVVWHPFLGESSHMVEVGEDRTVQVQVDFAKPS